MSRRPAAQGLDTAERNRATLKQLVKLESNKSCADCKRNKHPRWASWNLGIFVCIRCSGIHRSLGVHISRVKSVDLDSWTDEQMASMLKWGNKRANRYWEHKLAEGHVPNESKIENFIRTKYDSKRWVMDGPMPDPATLDQAEDGDDDVPLKVVQERARGNSVRNGSAPAAAQPPQSRARPQGVDLFGDPVGPTPQRPSTTEPSVPRPGPPKASAAPPRQTRPGESLLGLDFLGGTSSAPPARPSSTGPGSPAAPGRTDLKQSILSLYASKPAPTPQQAPLSNVNAFGGMQSPPLASPTQSNTVALGGLGDAFGSLSFTSPQQSQPKPPPFTGLTSPTGHSRQSSAAKQNPLSGGSFFDSKPVPGPAQTSARKESFGNFGDFSSAIISPAPTTSSIKSPAAASSGTNDLFSMSSGPTPPPKPAVGSAPSAVKQPPPIQASSYYDNTAFNLSQPTQPTAPKPAPPRTSTINTISSLSNADPWGSDNAWATPDPAPAPTQPIQPPPQTQASTLKPSATAPVPAMKMASAFDSGWDDPEPTPAKPITTMNTSSSSGLNPSVSGFGQSASGFSVQQDEEFGGWSHASPVAATSGPKQGGLGGNQDDLFGNVWG